MRFSSLAVLAVALVMVPSTVAAQDRACTERRPRVEKIEIEGNDAIDAVDLRSIIFTERAGRLRRWFGWNVGAFACLDSLELDRDTRRIAMWYGLRGYPGTTATATRIKTGDRTAHVRFVVNEAPPVVIDTVTFAGIPARVVDQRRFAAKLRGEPLDDSLLAAASDSIQQLLRAAGYARARPPARSVVVDSAARRARVTMKFTPGNLVRIGAISIDMNANNPEAPALNDRQVRELLRFRPGEVYDARDISASQQLLFSYDLYRVVAIDTIGAQSRGDTLPVRVRLTEGRHSWLRAGGGWGTIDCFRTQTRYVKQNFLGRAHRLQLDARLSKLGVGALEELSGACAQRVLDDPFSQKLNHYLGASVVLRGPVGDRWHPQATLYSERRTEFQSYMRDTYIGGLASFDKPLVPRVNTTFTYRFDAGRTESDQAVACASFGLCRFNDRALLLERSVTHAAGSTWSRSAPAISAFAVNDSRWAIESRFGTVGIGEDSTFQRVNFNRTQLEYAIYRPLTRTIIGAARLSGGIVATRRELEPFVPPQERFYSGGQNTVRGYNQGQLGPVVYIVGSYDSVMVGTDQVGRADTTRGFDRVAPAGGTATAMVNLELRSRVGWPVDILRWVVFVDAGRVWNNSGNYAVTGLRATPGVGMRLVTPLGPFRVDVAYNPHQYELGPAFYLQRASGTTLGRAICVSPGSMEPIDDGAATAAGPVNCPATYRPPAPRGLWPKLTFHFSIGEAF